MSSHLKALTPQDVSHLIDECAARGDLEGVAALYEDGAVMASTSGSVTVGRAGIRDEWARRPRRRGTRRPAPTVVRSGDIAVVSTVVPDALGQTTHVVRRQADGSWLRVIDQPDVVANLDAA